MIVSTRIKIVLSVFFRLRVERFILRRLIFGDYGSQVDLMVASTADASALPRLSFLLMEQLHHNCKSFSSYDSKPALRTIQTP